VRPHGRGHRQGPERPDPRGVWPAAHVHPDGAAGGGQLHQRGHRVHRHRRLLHLFHVSKFISVPFCAALVWYMVVRGRLQEHGKDLPRRLGRYIAYIFAGVLSQPSWHDALLATVQLPKIGVARQGLHLHGHRRGGHHHCAVDAVLPAVVDRGEGHSREGLRGLAARRDRRQPVSPTLWPGSSSWPARPRCLCMAWARSRCCRRTRPKPCGRWPATTPSSSSPSASSTRRCLRRRFCRSRRPTRFAKAWASSRAWTRASRKRRSSTGSTRC
jgi:hypothetical protein